MDWQHSHPLPKPLFPQTFPHMLILAEGGYARIYYEYFNHYNMPITYVRRNFSHLEGYVVCCYFSFIIYFLLYHIIYLFLVVYFFNYV